MSKRLKIILTASIVGVFLLVFILATFYDYQISQAIARLTDGKYLSDDALGNFFEIIGEFPMYIIGVFAVANLARASLQIKTLALKILLVCICVGAGVFAYSLMINRAIEYVHEQAGTLNAVVDKTREFIESWGVLIGSVVLMSLTFFLTFKIPEKYLSGLVAFSVAVLFTIALSQGVVQGVKVFMGRQRFRTMQLLDYKGFGDLVDYTPWYQINGARKVGEEMLALGIASDGYKSFPSGHTCAWAVLFTLTVLPDFLGVPEKKRVKIKAILIVTTILAVLFLGYTRIRVGAHFATDVLFAGAWTYLSVIISSLIAKKIVKQN